MNGPPRLWASGSARAKQLLRAGKNERPSSEAKTESLAAAAIVLLGHTSFTATSSALKNRWPLLVGLAIVGGAGVWSIARDPASALSSDEPWSSLQPAFVVRPRIPADVPPDREVSNADRSPRLTHSSWKREVTAATLSKDASQPTELELIRRARMELKSEEPSTALATLDEHAAAFPSGSFREAAAALRVEALARAGDATAARASAARFAEMYPESAYGERVRSIASALSR